MPETEEKKKVVMEKNKAVRNLLLLFLVIFVVVLAFNGLREAIAKKTLTFMKADTDVLYETVAGSGMAIYWETVYHSAYNGDFEPAAEEMDEINSGQTAGVLTVAATDMKSEVLTVDMVAEAAGIASYLFDGLEGVVTPDNVNTVEMGLLDEYYADTGGITKGRGTVALGDPVFKIIDIKGEPLLYLRLGDESFDELPSGNLLLRFSEGENVKGTILNGEKLEDGYGILLKLPVMPESFYLDRRKELEVVSASYSGIVIPQTALAEQDGEVGVFTGKNGVAVFLPVTVTYSVGDQVVVEGLDEGTYFISNPSHIHDGQILQ